MRTKQLSALRWSAQAKVCGFGHVKDPQPRIYSLPEQRGKTEPHECSEARERALVLC